MESQSEAEKKLANERVLKFRKRLEAGEKIRDLASGVTDPETVQEIMKAVEPREIAKKLRAQEIEDVMGTHNLSKMLTYFSVRADEYHKLARDQGTKLIDPKQKEAAHSLMTQLHEEMAEVFTHLKDEVLPLGQMMMKSVIDGAMADEKKNILAEEQAELKKVRDLIAATEERDTAKAQAKSDATWVGWAKGTVVDRVEMSSEDKKEMEALAKVKDPNKRIDLSVKKALKGTSIPGTVEDTLRLVKSFNELVEALDPANPEMREARSKFTPAGLDNIHVPASYAGKDLQAASEEFKKNLKRFSDNEHNKSIRNNAGKFFNSVADGIGVVAEVIGKVIGAVVFGPLLGAAWLLNEANERRKDWKEARIQDNAIIAQQKAVEARELARSRLEKHPERVERVLSTKEAKIAQAVVEAMQRKERTDAAREAAAAAKAAKAAAADSSPKSGVWQRLRLGLFKPDKAAEEGIIAKAHEALADQALTGLSDKEILDWEDMTYFDAKGVAILDADSVKALDGQDLYSKDGEGHKLLFKKGQFEPTYNAVAAGNVRPTFGSDGGFYQLVEGVTYYDASGNEISSEYDDMNYMDIYNEKGDKLRDGEKYEAALKAASEGLDEESWADKWRVNPEDDKDDGPKSGI